MKATVGRWTAIQTELPDDDAGKDLWARIEYRTWGKLGQSRIAIALNKRDQAMVNDAVRKLDERYGKYVEMAG